MLYLMEMNLSLKHLIFSLLILGHIGARAADSLKFSDIESIQTFSMDSKGNYYVADQANSLIKYNNIAKEITRVNTKLYGSIYSIDCTNPFEIYVYHKDQNILVFYDNMLNYRGELKMNKLNYRNIACVARSFDNGIWLFDYDAFELKKIDKEGKLSVSSGNLLTFVDVELNPYSITEYDNKIYLADSVAGILVFDIFGTFIKTIPLKGTIAICFNQNTLIAASKDKLYSYQLRTLEQYQTSLPNCCPTALYYNNKGIYYNFKNIIFRYSRS